MSATTADHPTVSHAARQRALAPFIARIREWCEEYGREENAGSFEMQCGGRVLSFEPPEFALLYHSALVAEETGQAEDRLAVEAIALGMKGIEDLARLRASTVPASPDYHAAQTELMLDGALGAALLAEMQARIDTLVSQGQIDPSKLLRKFNHRVWNAVAEVERVIAGTELERSRVLTDSLTDRPLDSPPLGAGVSGSAGPALAEPPGSLDLDASVVSLTREANASAEPDSRPAPSATTLLSLGLLVATLIWFGLFGPLRSSEPVGRALTLESFDGRLVAIDARPPSLYGSVDLARWEILDDAARLELVDGVGRVLSSSGYSGALLRTADGLPVAQWLASRGSQLLDDRELP